MEEGHTLDKIYEYILKEKKELLMPLLQETTLFTLVYKSVKEHSTGIKITISCNDEIERTTMAKAFQMHNISTRCALISDIDPSEFNTIYVKYVSQLEKYKDIEGKNFVLPNYPFNIADVANNTLALGEFADLTKCNQFHITSLYSDLLFDPVG